MKRIKVVVIGASVWAGVAFNGHATNLGLPGTVHAPRGGLTISESDLSQWLSELPSVGSFDWLIAGSVFPSRYRQSQSAVLLTPSSSACDAWSVRPVVSRFAARDGQEGSYGILRFHSPLRCGPVASSLPSLDSFNWLIVGSTDPGHYRQSQDGFLLTRSASDPNVWSLEPLVGRLAARSGQSHGIFGVFRFHAPPQCVPEPTTFALVGGGLALTLLCVKRKNQPNAEQG
jgi:hypothetical protein